MKFTAKQYLQLFFYTMKISAFTFGGGYVIVSLMKKQFVDKLAWLTEKQMLDYTAIAQSSPGAIAVNASILIGYQLGGALGAIVAILGTVFPPLVLLTAISFVYKQFIAIAAVRYVMLGMQAGVSAVICDVVWGLVVTVWKESKWIALITAVVSFALVSFLSVNVILIVVACAALGVVLYGKKGENAMLLELFWAFFQVGLFSIGGGYAALPLIQEQVIVQNSWMSAAEFTDLITISQMTPGPIAINAASFIGARVAGVPGAVVATFSCILPACVIVMCIAWLYRKYSKLSVIDGALKGLRPAVVGMIAAAALTMLQSSWFATTGTAIGGVDIAAIVIFAASLFVLRKWKPSPILVMICAGVLGLIVYSIFGGTVMPE